jgi:hypothetical protein
VGARSLIALLGGMILMFFLIEAIEPPTVALLASQRPADMESYLAARNEPGVLPGRLAIYAVIGWPSTPSSGCSPATWWRRLPVSTRWRTRRVHFCCRPT